MKNFDPTLTIPEAMEALRISRPVIYKLINNGQLQTHKIGKRRLTTQRCVEKCREKLSVKRGAA